MIRLGFVANPFSLPFSLALERGYFAQAGLEIEVERFANGSAATVALADGSIDAGVSGHIQTLLAGDGADRQVFVTPLGFEEAPSHLPITLLGTGDVRSAAALQGQRIAVSALGAISELQLRILMAHEGLDYRSVELVAMPFRDMADALRDGRVGAASVPEPFASALQAQDVGQVIDRGSLSRGLRTGQRAMIAGIAAKRSWVDAEPALAASVASVIGQAIDELVDDPAIAIAMMAGQIDGPSTAGMQAPRFDRTLVPADLQIVFDLAHAHGLLKQSADAAVLFA